MASFKYDDLLQLYEKHYLFEVDMREKLLARLQVSFAMIASLGSIIFYVASNLKSFPFPSLETVGFSIFGVLLSSSFLAAFFYFYKGIIGYTYQFIPLADDTESYRQSLIATYSSFPNCDDLIQQCMNDYLCQAYVQCASINTSSNERRSVAFFNGMKYIVISFILAVVMLLFFFIGHFNDAPTKELCVNISKPVEIKGGPVGLRPREESKQSAPRRGKGKKNRDSSSAEPAPKDVKINISNSIEVMGGVPHVVTVQESGRKKDSPSPSSPTLTANQGGI